MSQLRKNILNNEWAIIANERSGRPYQYGESKNEKCPFCPGNEDMTPNEILRINDENGNWLVRVVPNKFPTVKEVNEIFEWHSEPLIVYEKDGYHELVIGTPLHDIPLHKLGFNSVLSVFNIFKERYIHLSKLKDIKYVQIFKNCGKYGGASIPHSHSQIIALPVIPPRLKRALEISENYYNKKNKCLICDLINTEIKKDVRVIYTNKSFVSCLSFAPRFCYETVIYPLNHNGKFSDINDCEMMDFIDAFLNTMKLLENVLGEFPYNFILNTTPQNYLSHYHWHMEIVPRIMHHAGMELATGIFVQSISPEEAVQKIKETIE
jgi:UDPglucose--hexose-1-phosphate uridylyltransferase